MNAQNRQHTTEEVKQTLGANREPNTRRRWKAILLLLLLLCGVLGFLYWSANRDGPAYRFETATVSRGDLTITVTATGSLQPTNQVDVSSELSGIIETVYVDYNDRIQVGQPLAKLDTAKLEAQVTRSAAALRAAEARVQQAEATMKEARAELDRLRRVRELSGGKVPSAADLDSAEATLQRARADRASAQAAVAEARATLESNRTDLSKAVIVSPINGVVLDRSVEPGQTVASSLQAPVLFTLAEDLAQMELEVDVDEADVGQVQAGQRATFSVDAYPEERFPADVMQVRYGSQTVDGVVSYTTVLQVDNADLKLRPGMTATAEIVVDQVEDGLLVPAAALRFTPPQAPAATQRSSSLLGSLFPRPPRPAKTNRKDSRGNTVWIQRDGQLQPIAVRTGLSDGTFTQVFSADLQAGIEVLVGVRRQGR